MPRSKVRREVMKRIVGFSGGAASSVVGKIVAEQYPHDTVLLFHNTHTEPIDNDRFRKEVSDYIGLPITVIQMAGIYGSYLEMRGCLVIQETRHVQEYLNRNAALNIYRITNQPHYI